ncbi:MAG: beta-propeller fold lactonase family protein [Nocardioides sp.]|nr:beta-propeller fold lactonase family protein [Nocardioides sp.]
MLTSVRRTGVASLALTAALGTVGATGIASPASADEHHRDHRGHGGSAVFVQTDDPAGNTIVAYDRAPDGTLTPAGQYATGGLGGVLDGSVVDHLASQGSLALDREHDTLYAVNAGSDTVTVFGVAGDRLSRRAVVPSGGSFPVSIAVHGDLVYVLNARDGGTVQGFRSLHGGLVPIAGSTRALGLDATATPEFVNTPGQVAFSPDGSRLLVTTKSNGNDVDVFTVGRSGALSGSPTVNSLPGAVPFAVSWDRFGRLVLAEAGPNAVATFRIDHDGVLHAIATAATGQAATCWVVRSGDRLFASNAGSATLSAYRVGLRGDLTSLGTTGTDAGTVDATVTPDGRYLFVQAGAAGQVDGFRIGWDGSLTSLGSVTVPGAVGGEGIAAD